jgi:HD-like signal output (HDOD) protein
MPFKKEEIIQHIDKLPAFSSTVSKIMLLANNPKASPGDLIQAISLDPLMTTKVLGLINSAYFSMREKVVSLKRAVIMLGFNTIKNVAIGSAVVSSIKMRNNYRWFTGDQFWEHSLGVGIAAKIIASKTGVSAQDQDEYFIAGLLHDIGKVVFIMHNPDEHANISASAFEPGTRKTELEAKEFGIDHAELGGLVGKKWDLPPSLLEPIRFHHTLAPTGNPVFDKVVAAVHVSDFICNEREIGIKNRRGIEQYMVGDALKVLSIAEKDVANMFSELEKKVEDAKVFLKN